MSGIKRFDGLTVLITGAAGGFGKDTARLFAEEGANLVLSDYSEKATSAIVEELRQEGYQATGWPVILPRKKPPKTLQLLRLKLTVNWMWRSTMPELVIRLRKRRMLTVMMLKEPLMWI